MFGNVHTFTKRIAVILLAILCLLSAGGCGTSPEKILTGFGKEEVFKINNAIGNKTEYLVYLATTQARYEEVYGPEVWNVAKGDIALEDNVKQTVLNRLAAVKVMTLLAEQKQISLSEQEDALAESAAEKYMGLLKDTVKEEMGLTQEKIFAMYKEYALSEKVHRTIMETVNPEISDDEARTVTVQNILFKTWTTDGTGARVYFSDSMKAEVYVKAQEALALAKDGEDFTELISKYNEDDETVLSFGKGEVEAVLERMAFALETGEVSPILESDEGYRIIKCVSTFDSEETERNKVVILEKRRKEAFQTEYDSFLATVESRLNETLLQEISPAHDNRIEVPDFFAIYEEVF